MKLPPDDKPGSTIHSYAGGWQPPTVARMQHMLPQYEFVEMLGAGGMGAVYKARQVSLDRLVAIKILPPGLEDGGGANFTERFKQEARTMAKMNHPCIVHVHDFGETAEGQLYFVMEFVEGTDVQKMIRANKRLSPDDALAITAHVCDALEYAHDRGVIHRDIKPANVLINADGQVKIADFGLAKAVDNKSHELTRSNIAMGTPHFMAPETMCADVKVDARADLYAVGVMLHNMLTGEIPSGLFKLPSKKVGCDTRFDDIVSRAMEADRDERYQTAGQIRKDLDTILSTPVPKAAAGTSAVAKASRKEAPAKKPAEKKQPAAEPPPKPKAESPMAKYTEAPKSGLGKISGIISGMAVVALGAAVFFSGGRPRGVVAPVPAAHQPAVGDAGPVPANGPPAPAVAKPSPDKPSPVAAAKNPAPSTPAAPARFTPTSEPWMDALADPASTSVRGGSMQRTPDGLLLSSGSVVEFSKLSGSDHAVRVIAQLTSSNSAPYISLRADASRRSECGIGLTNRDSITYLRWSEGRSETGKTWKLARALNAGDQYELEARIVGDTVTISVDGQKVDSFTDGVPRAGTANLKGGSRGGLLRAVQYLDLSAKKTATAPVPGFSPSSEPWVDALAEPGALLLKGDAARTADGLRIGSGRATFAQLQGADYAVRMIVAYSGLNKGPKIQLRNQGYTNYLFRLVPVRPTGHVQVVRGFFNRTEDLVNFPVTRRLNPGDTYEIEARMVGSRISVAFDGVAVGSVEDTLSRAGTVTIGSEGTNLLLRAVQYLDLSATKTATANDEKWNDVLAEFWTINAKANFQSDYVAREAGGTRVGKIASVKAWTTSEGDMADVALRTTVSGSESWALALRGGPQNSRYRGTIFSGSASILFDAGGGAHSETLKQVPLPAGFVVTARHTTEFRARGETLTLLLDGTELLSVKDTRFKNGIGYIFASPGTLIEKLEYRELPAPDGVGGALPVITGWQSMMDSVKSGIASVGVGELTEDNGWLVLSNTKGFSSVPLPKWNLTDTAIRGRVRGEVYVGLRCNRALPGYYSVRFRKDGTGLIEQITSNPRKTAVLANFAMTRALEHAFLVTMTGPDIRLWVDGELVATARDTTIASGSPLVNMPAQDCAIRDFEVAALPADFFGKAPAPAEAGAAKP